MPTSPQDIPRIEGQIKDLQPTLDSYQSKLNDSPTALGGEGQPTATDIANQQGLEKTRSQIQTLTDQKLKTQWYGSDTPAPTAPVQQEGGSAGLIGGTLDYLTRPLYGVVGAVKHVIGQGSGTLQQDVADNMVRNKNTFGDVLKSANVPWGVAATLGMGLDLGLDPVNLFTFGTGTLIGRIGMGAIKGVTTGEGLIKGVATAAKSGVMEDLNTVGRFTPGLRKTEAFKNFGTKTLAATDDWEKLSGITAESLALQKGMGVGQYRIGLGKLVNKAAETIPGGRVVLENLVYDPVNWCREARIKDIFQEKLGLSTEGMRDIVNIANKDKSIEPFMQKAREEASAKMAGVVPETKATPLWINTEGELNLTTQDEVNAAIAKIKLAGMDEQTLNQAAHTIVGGVDDAISINKNPSAYVSADTVENAYRIIQEKLGGESLTLDNMIKIVNSGALDQTGVKWFDEIMNGKQELIDGKMVRTKEGIRSFTLKINKNSDKAVEIGKKTMDMFDISIAAFKMAKVALSPSSWTNAIVGNTAMTHMIGLLSTTFLKRLKQTADMYRGKPAAAAFIDSLMMDGGGYEDVIRKNIHEYKTVSKATFGDINFVGNPFAGQGGMADFTKTAEKLLLHGRDAGILPAGVTAESLAPELKQVVAEIIQKSRGEITDVSAWAEKKNAETAAKGAKDIYGARLHGDLGPNVTRREIAEKGFENIDKNSLPTGMMSQEIYNTKAVAELSNYIAQRAKENPSNLSWKLADFCCNKMPAGYESLDQSFKLTTFITATVDGLTLDEIRNVRHYVNITPEEITLGKYSKNGQYLYRLSPSTAMDLTNIAYLNYAAMPAAIRVLKNMPFVGSPFISFMYGMTLKTGQTLAYNPAAFNKVSFAMNDFGGTETPLEKKALTTPFYSYLNKPGMYRIPFFDKNPIYINASNMIPYYSLNMFNPSQTSYGDSAREKVVQAVQNSSLMSDPYGSVLFNYLILPTILGEAIRPQSQFGSPLYPVDATGVEKVGYAARSLGEAFVPNIASYAGLVTPESVADYIPSYRWRQLALAKNAKTRLGISGKEPAASRTIRTLLQISGVPVQASVNTAFGAGQADLQQ